VPPVVYQSVFADTPTGVEMQSVDWKKTNAQVGQFKRGHVDILKWEESQRATQGNATAAAAPLTRDANGDQAALTGLLTAPVTADTAVRIALLNNTGHPSGMGKPTTGQDAGKLVADTRKAWISAVAAQQIAVYLRDVKDAAQAGAELARRMAKVGNWSRLEQAREQVLLAEATAQLARAEQTSFSEREKLIRLMGLWGSQISFTLVERLPDLPQAAAEMSDIEARALRGRPDVRTEGAGSAYGAVQVRSEAREAYHGYRTAYDLARHYRDEIVPLRKFINDEIVLRYNGMLASVWDLLADTRQQVGSINSAIEAQRDFWLAETDLQTTLTGLSTGGLAGITAPAGGMGGDTPAVH
jgi:hypothetical protein